MSDHWGDEIFSIMSKGIPLSPYGVNSFGLPRQVVLVALEELRSLGVAVLGGDVYLDLGDSVRSTYDNWYSNRLDGEPQTDFVERSIGEAIRYVENYKSEGSPLFVLVPDAHGPR